jgi:hypothetical protein
MGRQVNIVGIPTDRELWQQSWWSSAIILRLGTLGGARKAASCAEGQRSPETAGFAVLVKQP